MFAILASIITGKFQTRKYLTRDATEIVIHAFVTSKLDYCDSMYHGLPWFLSPKLQAVQNSEI